MSGDARPLPPGWSAHRDERTGSMFYVNHSSQPATMSYAHPLDSAPQAAAVQQHAQAAAPPPPQQVAHSIEYAARPASRASPQPSVSSGRSGSTGADRAQPPGTTGVRELHTVATPPVPLPPRSPPPPMHSRSVSMSMAYAPPQQLQYVPPPPPPRLASNPHRTSTYTPRLPTVQVQQPVQQQQQQQQPSRVTALYAAQAGVQPTGKTGRWSSFFGTPKSQPFQQQIIPLQQSVTRPPPATIYQQQQRPQIVTQPFQQQQFVPQQQQQFVPQQQQQQFVPQQQQLAPQQQQFVPQQQVQQAQAAQQFVAPQQQQQQQLLVSQQMQPLPPLPQQLAIPQQQQVSQPLQQHPVVPQQQQAAVQQNIAPATALDPQVLLQLSALLAQQQGVDQAQILQQLLVAQQQLQPVAQTQQVGPSPLPQSAGVSHQAAHGGIPVTAPQPVHPIPAQLSLGPSPSPSPQSPQAALAQYAPGLGLYTSQQASPPAAVGSPPAALQQSVTASPALSASGVSSFDATFPVDMNPSSTSPEDAAVPPDAQEPQYEQNLSTPAEMEPLPVIQPESVAHAEPLPATSDADHIVPGAEENGADSPGPLPAYSLEPPNSAPPMTDSFVADAILQEMAQAAESVVEAIQDPEGTLATQPPQEFEVPAQTESSQSPVSPTQYTPGGRTVRPALPPRPSGPRSDRRLAGHAVSSHVNGSTLHSSAPHAHGPGVVSHVSPSPGAVHPAPSAGLHQNGVPATSAHAASPPPAHAASPSPSISPPNGVHAQSHSPAQGIPTQQYAAYQPAAGVPPVAQTPHAQYQPAHQQQQQSPVYTQQQQQSPVYSQQQQQQQSQQQYQQQQQPQQQYQQQQQQQQQSASTSPPPPPPKPYAVYPDPGKQQSIGGRLSSFMSSPTTQAIAAKGAGLLGNLFVRTAVNAVTDSDSGSNYGYLNTGPSATDIAAGLAGNVVQNAIQHSIAPSPQPGLAGTAGLVGNATQGLAGTHTQAQLIQAQIQAQAQANTNALLQSMQGSQQAQTAAALLQAQKIQAANAQAQQQNVQAQLAALLKMQQQQQSAQQAQQQAVLQQVQQQQAAQQAQQQAALQEAQQQAALQQAQQQALLQQVQQQQAAQQAQQQAMLEQVQQQQEAQQQAAYEQLQQQTAMYQSQQQAALEQMQAQNVFTPQIFASTNYEQPNGSGMDTLAQTIAQAMPQQSGIADPYSQAFSPDGGMAQAQIQGTSPDFLGALSQAIMGGAQTASYDPSAFLGAQQPGADASAMQAMTDALSQMQLGSQQMMSGGYDGSQQQTDYSQYLSSFGANDIIDSAVTNSV